jgi:hypothetical protein
MLETCVPSTLCIFTCLHAGLPNDSPKGLLPAGSKYSLRNNVIASTATSTASGCTFQLNVDYDEGTLWVQNKSKDQVYKLLLRSFLYSNVVVGQEECCAQCTNYDGCAAAVFSDGICYYKHPNAKPVYKSVWLS